MNKDLKIAIGIQARSSSTRLPNKISQMIGNKMVIDHVIDACKNAAEYINRYTFTNHTHCDVFVLIPEGDSIKECLRIDQDFILEGSERDVLSRYMTMARMSEATHIVRITGDCPLIPPFLIYKCINAAIKNSFDYFSNVGDIGPESMRTSIDGHDVEVISIKALEWAEQNARSDFQKEHVSIVLRDDLAPSSLRRGILIGHNDHSNIKLSVDTEDDLKKIRDEFDKIQRKITQAKAKYGKGSVHRF